MLALSFGTIVYSAEVQAQTSRATARYPGEEMRDSLLKGVALTDSQKASVETIARGYWELMHANDARMSALPRDSVRAFMRELVDTQISDLRRLLTPAQQKQFDENRKAK